MGKMVDGRDILEETSRALNEMAREQWWREFESTSNEVWAQPDDQCNCDTCVLVRSDGPSSEIGVGTSGPASLIRSDTESARQQPAGGALLQSLPKVEREIGLFINRVVCYASGAECATDHEHCGDINHERDQLARRIIALLALDSAVPPSEETDTP